MEASYSAQSTVWGAWAVEPAPGAGQLAFDVPFAQAASAPTWRDELPAGPGEAAAHLAEKTAQLEASRASLAAASSRLDAFVERARQAGEVSFGVPAAEGKLAGPELALQAALEDLQPGGRAESFGLGEALAPGWDDVSGQFKDFVARLQTLVAHYAWVETRLEGRLLGWTAVAWTGDVRTLWQVGISPAQAELHQHNLRLALEHRDAMFSLFILVTQGAVKLSALLATPGGAVLAVPAAWKFINEVLAELDRRPHTPRR
jgi:hypothetical protein